MYQQHKYIIQEIFRLIVFVLLGIAVGYHLNVSVSFSIGISAYIVVVVLELLLFYSWLNNTIDHYPRTNRVLYDIARRIDRLKNRNKQTKKALKLQIQRVQKSSAALSYGVMIVDGTGVLTWWNKAAATLLRLNKSAHRGVQITSVIDHSKFKRFLESNNTQPILLPSPIEYGKTFEWQVSVFGVDDEKLIIVRDISRIKKLERMRVDFVGNVSHELRTPLTVLHGYIENFQMLEGSLPPIINKAVGQMSEQVTRMNSIVDDLMLLSALDESDHVFKNERINLNELLGDVFTSLKVYSSGKHNLKLELPEYDCFTTGAQKELYSAFSNLAFNAVKYTAEGGLITLSLIVDDDQAIVMVKDNGEGIDKREIPRLTERFYRVDRSRSRDVGGTGLGLAIVKHVLIRHNAQLDIKSKVGIGSTFTCRLSAWRGLPEA